MAPTDDELVFGKDAWVYCYDHCKPHMTGWCGIGVSHKLGLGLVGRSEEQNAYDKCELFNLRIYNPNQSKPQGVQF
jgi:hypothetical protein